MHSMIQTVHRNGHSDFFASDEWRGGESITVKDHTKLPGKVFSKRARSATSRLQTAPIGADYLFFPDAFVAILIGEDIESQTLTETLTETVMFFHYFTCPITSCVTVFTVI